MISLILPVHNEASSLRECVSSVAKAAAALGEHEIIIAEDGSTDGTLEIARKLESESVRLISTKERIGRGASLSNAIRKAGGDIVVYMDADLSTSLEHLPALVSEIRNGADIATGSRLLPQSSVRRRGFLRELFSRGYNLMLRILFGSRIHDHQCGFKAFRKPAVLPLLEGVRDRHWFWDSELLIRAQRRGLGVSEIPVRWRDRQGSRVDLSSDVLSMGLAAIRLRLSLR